MTTRAQGLTRRQAIALKLMAGAGLAASYALVPGSIRTAHAMQSHGEVLDTQPFARLEQIADGVYAVVSTPFQARAFETVCNGGFVVGRERIVAIDAYFQPQGGAWLAERCKAITGRYPTDVILTHYHLDHIGGLAGFQRGAEGPAIIATQMTYETLLDRYGTPQADESNDGVANMRARLLLPTVILSGDEPYEIDLGGRKLTLSFEAGHTQSDVVARVDDPNVVFAGDMLWDGIVPNFVDAQPSLLMRNVRALLAESDVTLVPGHGSVSQASEMADYLGLLEAVEAAARQAYQDGQSAEDAAAAFTVPASLGEWKSFGPDYYRVAIAAWLAELTGADTATP